MKVKFKPESDFVFPSYYSTSYYLIENFGLTPDSFIGEYADYLLLIMRQVISERACLMLL